MIRPASPGSRTAARARGTTRTHPTDIAGLVYKVYRPAVDIVDRRCAVASNGYLGEFEQMVLLAIMQGGEDANALQVRRELEENANRSVTKGAFYTTLDRLSKKNYVTWEARVPDSGRRGLPQRHFKVTPQGVDELRRSRQALMKLWRGLEGLLDAT